SASARLAAESGSSAGSSRRETSASIRESEVSRRRSGASAALTASVAWAVSAAAARAPSAAAARIFRIEWDSTAAKKEGGARPPSRDADSGLPSMSGPALCGLQERAVHLPLDLSLVQ